MELLYALIKVFLLSNQFRLIIVCMYSAGYGVINIATVMIQHKLEIINLRVVSLSVILITKLTLD